MTLLDQIRGFLGNGVQSAGQVTRDLERHNRGIDHTYILGTVDPEIGADDSALLSWEHAVGTNGVVVGPVYEMLMSHCFQGW